MNYTCKKQNSFFRYTAENIKFIRMILIKIKNPHLNRWGFFIMTYIVITQYLNRAWHRPLL